jgi:peptidoglycan/xylan/chitin deacetylase (PgdA/CDA1 family)
VEQVTLTFDNGPVPGITDRVLDILDRTGLKTTFFVIGRNLLDPDAAALMREAQSAGHWIGNHTLTHSVALGDRPEANYAREEIEGAQDLIGSCSRADKLFRPYGRDGLIGPHLLSEAALTRLLDGKYTCVLWNSVPGDWRDPEGWVERCLAEVQDQAWSVVVLHDIAHASLGRLPELLHRLQDRGAVFRQDFPDDVIVTRGGQVVNSSPDYVADWIPREAAHPAP